MVRSTPSISFLLKCVNGNVQHTHHNTSSYLLVTSSFEIHPSVEKDQGQNILSFDGSRSRLRRSALEADLLLMFGAAVVWPAAAAAAIPPLPEPRAGGGGDPQRDEHARRPKGAARIANERA